MNPVTKKFSPDSLRSPIGIFGSDGYGSSALDFNAEYTNTGTSMVLILDGNLDKGAHVSNNLCYLTWLRHLIRPRAVTNRIFFCRKIPVFIHSCATCFELPSNLSTMGTSDLR